MAWSAWALPALVDPHRAPAGYRAIPARDDGGRREENALVLGQPRDARVITESGGIIAARRRGYNDTLTAGRRQSAGYFDGELHRTRY